MSRLLQVRRDVCITSPLCLVANSSPARAPLHQVFKGKSAEFREAIASILGFKIAFHQNGEVRVTSIFDLNAAFVFKSEKDKDKDTGKEKDTGKDKVKMQLIAKGDGGPEELPQLMAYWVEQEQCIPGFLASVTLQSYEAMKMEREREQEEGLVRE